MIESSHIIVRNTQQGDFSSIIEMTREVYPDSPSWTIEQLTSHLSVFPEGQLVAIEKETQKVVGMAASLIVLWDDYDMETNWRDFTDHGFFTNHDPAKGRTLYGAEVMVCPSTQGHGIGKMLYAARREIVEKFNLLRIRAGSRLRGYHRFADKMSAEEYVKKVIKGELGDLTLSFQIKQGFYVLAVISNYLRSDSESLGYAAVIEWLNEKIAKPEDYKARKKFMIQQGD